jgi:hypothetical protein
MKYTACQGPAMINLLMAGAQYFYCILILESLAAVRLLYFTFIALLGIFLSFSNNIREGLSGPKRKKYALRILACSLLSSEMF